MIFNVEGHIQKIISGEKTQTRRTSDKYSVGKFYTIQPNRNKKGVPEGKIFITAKRREWKTPVMFTWYIMENEAELEGGYTPMEYEELYEKMFPNWKVRYCYMFTFFSTSEIEEMEWIEKGCDMKDTVLCEHYHYNHETCKYGESHGKHCPYDHVLKKEKKKKLRSRNKDGRWRKKRSDAGKPRKVK